MILFHLFLFFNSSLIQYITFSYFNSLDSIQNQSMFEIGHYNLKNLNWSLLGEGQEPERQRSAPVHALWKVWKLEKEIFQENDQKF